MQNFNTLQYPQYRPQMPIMYKAMPVSSEAEMNNITVDFNGTPTYFHNQATNEIYVKQFDMRTGVTSVQKFIKFQADSKPDNEGKEEKCINTYKEDFNALNDRLDGLEQLLKNLQVNEAQKGGKNVK